MAAEQMQQKQQQNWPQLPSADLKYEILLEPRIPKNIGVVGDIAVVLGNR